jgi:ring-1,2-phenylacetyl-CoA epoxidase subunit PaaC
MNEHLVEYCLRIGDTGTVLSHRLGEWCGHGPMLEEDIAMTNISLDLLGQARAFLTYAGEVEGKGRSEDDLAYHRDERAYRNVLLAELPNGDFARTMMRQYFVSAFQVYFFEALRSSTDETLKALAEKSLKEVTYHLRHSSEWLKRLGGGTAESLRRLNEALDECWPYTGDLFEADETDTALAAAGIGVDLSVIRPLWDQHVAGVFADSGLSVPQNVFMILGSRSGRHTEHLGHMLAEMQTLQRAFPGAQW